MDHAFRQIGWVLLVSKLTVDCLNKAIRQLLIKSERSPIVADNCS